MKTRGKTEYWVFGITVWLLLLTCTQAQAAPCGDICEETIEYDYENCCGTYPDKTKQEVHTWQCLGDEQDPPPCELTWDSNKIWKKTWDWTLLSTEGCEFWPPTPPTCTWRLDSQSTYKGAYNC